MIDFVLTQLSEEWPTFALLGLCFALFVYAERQKPDWRALAGVASYATALVLMNLYRLWPSGTDEMLHGQYEIWGTGNQLAVLVYLPVMFVCFVLLPPKDGRLTEGYGLIVLIWIMVIVAEAWTGLMENTNCNFWQTDIPFELQTAEQKEMSKCERIYGEWYSYAPLALQIALMFVFFKWFGWAKTINRRLRRT